MMKKRVVDTKGQRLIFMVSSVLLTILAIVQVFVIFGLPAGEKNSVKKGTAAASEAIFVYPERIYVTMGGKDNDVYFSVEDEQEEFAPLVQEAFALTERLMKEGEFQKKTVQDLTWNVVSCAVTFPCTLDQIILEEVFGVSELPVFSFSQMIIYPSAQTGTDPCAVFLSSDDETVWTVQTKKVGKLFQREWKENLALCEDLMTLSFDPDIQSGVRYMEVGHQLKMFSVGTFAEETMTRLYARRGSISQPFLEEGKMKENVIDEYAVKFFDSPESVTRLVSESSIVYSDEKISLKVSEDGWVEYRETLTDSEKEPVDLLETYRIALDFMETEIGGAETGINTILADFQKDEDSMIFMFDYEIEGKLMEIGGEGSLPGMHPVTVTVTGGKVRKYQRLIILPEMEEETIQIDENWVEVMDLYAEEGIAAVHPPVLVYYFDGKTIAPAWKFPVPGREAEDALIIPVS